MEKYKDSAKDTGIIGHFGLGFYSAFMVAEKVEIITKSYKNSTINHFIKKTKNNSKKRYQIKQDFNNNELSNYILNNAYTPIINFLKLD